MYIRRAFTVFLEVQSEAAPDRRSGDRLDARLALVLRAWRMPPCQVSAPS